MNFQFSAFNIIATKCQFHEKQRRTSLTTLSGPTTEVELLLNVVLEYKKARTAKNFDWQTCQTKYTDILDLFPAIPHIFVKKTCVGLWL